MVNTAQPTSILQKVRQSFNVSGFQPLDSSTDVPLDQPVTQTDALDMLDQALSEAENTAGLPAPMLDGPLAQVLPQAAQQTDAVGQTQVAGRSLTKEAPVTSNLDQVAGDLIGGAGLTELEPAKELEIPVEVESYLQKVSDHQNQLPQEIVVADDGLTVSSQPYPKQPVIVLPITPEIEQVGAAQPPSLSVRWLVEWSRKIMKMFEGMVIYRQDLTN